MLQTIKRKIKKITAGLAFIFALYSSSPALAEDGWANIQPAFNTRANHAILRMEGGSNITDKLSCYGWFDADAASEKPCDFENFYGEGRLTYKINNILGIAAEYNGGNNCKDTVRFGITITPKTNKKNFTMFKYFPYETTGKKGQQLCLFSSQKLTPKLGASLIIDYNLDKKTWYVEPELNYKLNNNSTMFTQGRSFGSIDDKMEFSPIFGIRYKF